MDLIILNDGLYQLIPVTKQMLEGIELISEINGIYNDPIIIQIDLNYDIKYK